MVASCQILGGTLSANQLAELERLEKGYATNKEFMDRAAHLLLVARSRRTATPAALVVPI